MRLSHREAKALGLAVPGRSGGGNSTCRPTLPPGTVVCRGVVPGRACPWKAFPRVSAARRKALGYGALGEWKRTVNAHAALLMAGRPPYEGPVSLSVTFYLHPAPGRPPDRANLLKAFEDGLEGVCYPNDTTVSDGQVRRHICPRCVERVEFEVIAL